MSGKEFETNEKSCNKNSKKIAIIAIAALLVVSVVAIALLLPKFIKNGTADSVKGSGTVQVQDATDENIDFQLPSEEGVIRTGFKSVALNNIAIFVEFDQEAFKSELVLYNMDNGSEKVIYSKEPSFDPYDIKNIIFNGETVCFEESIYEENDLTFEDSGKVDIVICNIKTEQTDIISMTDSDGLLYFDDSAVFYNKWSVDIGRQICKYDLKTKKNEVVLNEGIGDAVLYNENIFYALEKPGHYGPEKEPYVTYVYNFKTGEKNKISDGALPIYMGKDTLGYITEENGDYTFYTSKPDGSETKVVSSLDEIDGKGLSYYKTAFDGRYLYSYIDGDGLYVFDTETSSSKKFADSKFEQFTIQFYSNVKSDGNTDVYAIYGDNIDEDNYTLDYVCIALDGLNEPETVLTKNSGEFWNDDDIDLFLATDKGVLFAQTYENSSTGFEFVPFE